MRIFLRSVSLFFLLLSSLVAQSQTMDWGWSRSYGSTGNESINCIATDSKNGIYATSRFSGDLQVGTYNFTSMGGQDFILMKHDTSGNLIWAKAFGGTGNDIETALSTDADGNVLVGGHFDGTINFDAFSLTSSGSLDGFVAKINSSGTVIWVKKVGGNDWDIIDVLKCYRNDIYIGGRYFSTDFSIDGNVLTKTHAQHNFLARLNDNGIGLWAAKGSGTRAGESENFPFNDIEISDDHVVQYFGYLYTSQVNFNPSNTFGMSSLTWQSAYRVKFTTDGVFINQNVTGLGARGIAGKVGMGSNKKVVYTGLNTTLTNTLVNAAMVKRDSLDATLNGNAASALVPAPIGGPPSSTSSLSDAAVDRNDHVVAAGYFAGGTNFNYGFRSDTAGTGFNAALIWGTDSQLITKNILTSRITDKFRAVFSRIAIDTNTNIAYAAGYFQKLSTENNFIIGADTFPAQGGNDILISKIYRNAVAPPALLALAGNDTTICSGTPASIGIGASGGSPAYSYRWTPATGLQNPYAAVTMANPAVTTTYVLIVNDSHLTIAKDTIIVTVRPPLATPTITVSGPLSFCPGGSVTLTASAAANYLWSTGATTQSITVSAAGNYTVSISDGTGCSSAAATATVNVFTEPAQPVVSASGPLQFCQGGSVTLTATAASAYLWSNGATTQSITVNTGGNYSVIVSNTDGCSSVASAATAVTVWATPAQPVITASGAIQFCNGGSVTLTSSAASTYLWSNGATTQSITVSTAGTYSVITGSADGCSSVASAPVTVTVWSNPAKPVITASGPLQFCAGGSVGLSASAATAYLWSNGAATQNIIATSTGNYTVIVSNTEGCTSPASDPVTVNVLANPAQPVVSASGPLQFCEGGSVTLSSTSGSSYLWSNGATTQNITVNTGNNYSVVVTNNDGCSSVASAPVTVTVHNNPAQPVITASGSLSFCQGDNVTLTSSTANAYSWNNGATTQSITVNNAGNFSVIVSNAQGCNSIASAITSTTVNALPPVPTISRSGNQLISSAATGNQWYFDGNAIPGATSSTLTISGFGNYSVEVTNAEGCSRSSAPFTVESLLGEITILNNGDRFIHLTRPNPANTQAILNFQLANPAKVSVALVSDKGNLAAMPLTTRQMAAGSHEIKLDNFIRLLPAGVYYIVYRVNNERITDKLVIVK